MNELAQIALTSTFLSVVFLFWSWVGSDEDGLSGMAKVWGLGAGVSHFVSVLSIIAWIWA